MKSNDINIINILLIGLILFFIYYNTDGNIYNIWFKEYFNLADTYKNEYDNYVDDISEYYTITYILDFIKAEIDKINNISA